MRTHAAWHVAGAARVSLRGARAAFTLIEIMLAIGIFAMVLTAIYSSWSAILRAARVGGDAAAEIQRSRIASRTLQEALSATVMFAGNAYLYAFEADTSQEYAALSFGARLPASFPGSGYFGDQVVRRVMFSVERRQDGVNQLLLTQLPLLQTNVDAQDYHTLVLARDVNLFAVEFFDGRANRWTEEWIQTNQLPKAVRFALAFGQQARATQTKDVTMRLVLLGSSAVAADWQTPRGLGPGGAGGPAGPGGPGAPGVGPAGTGAATGDQTGTDQGAGARRWGRDGAADRLFPPPGAGGGSRLMPGRRP